MRLGGARLLATRRRVAAVDVVSASAHVDARLGRATSAGSRHARTIAIPDECKREAAGEPDASSSSEAGAGSPRLRDARSSRIAAARGRSSARSRAAQRSMELLSSEAFFARAAGSVRCALGRRSHDRFASSRCRRSRRSPATLPGYHAGRPPRNKGRLHPADPPTVEEFVAVMRQTSPRSTRLQGLRSLIVVLWRGGGCERRAARARRARPRRAARVAAGAQRQGRPAPRDRHGTPGAGSNCGSGLPPALSYRSGRCSASSTARRAGGPGGIGPIELHGYVAVARAVRVPRVGLGGGAEREAVKQERARRGQCPGERRMAAIRTDARRVPDGSSSVSPPCRGTVSRRRYAA